MLTVFKGLSSGKAADALLVEKANRIYLEKAARRIIYEMEKKEALVKIGIYNRRAPGLIAGGTLLIIVFLGTMFFMIAHGHTLIVWIGGVLLGMSMIGKGIVDLRDEDEVLISFKRKYNEKLTTHRSR